MPIDVQLATCQVPLSYDAAAVVAAPFVRRSCGGINRDQYWFIVI